MNGKGCPYCITDKRLDIQNNWLFDIKNESITMIRIPQHVNIRLQSLSAVLVRLLL
jgi:glutaredoxin